MCGFSGEVMRRTFFIFVCFLFLCMGMISGWCEDDVYDWKDVVQSVQELHRQANSLWPDHFQQGEEKRRGNEFDPSEYFRVLTHIFPKQGLALEYLYCGGMDGRPVFYWKSASQPGPENCETDTIFVNDGGSPEKIAENLEVDGTLESFYELFVFKTLAGQFYLSWHANYNDTQIVLSQEDVEKIIQEINAEDFGAPLDEAQQKVARALDVAPSAEFWDEESAQISVVTFSKWGGFIRVTQKIRRIFPHVVLEERREPLVEYHCGLMF